MNAPLSMSWYGAWCVRPELAAQDCSGAAPVASFLTDAARESALAVLQQHFTEDVFLSWLESLSRSSYLEAELGEIPSEFERLYVRRGG